MTSNSPLFDRPARRLSGAAILLGSAILAASMASAQADTRPAEPLAAATESQVIAAGDKPVSISVDGAGAVTIASGDDPAGAMAATSPATPGIDAPPNAPALPHDLSPWGMFMQADWVVKAVMIGLALASIATWTVLVAKTRELAVLVKRQRQTLTIVADAESLKAAHQKLEHGKGSLALTLAAAKELNLSANTLADADGVKERVASSLERLEAASGRNITQGTGILATIGSTAPFVGLFGTVWGIMNSFIGISKAQTTNLAVVAPGIAEALLATALGLVAAIPAVVIYNHFARQIAAYKALVGDTSAAVLRLVSRDLSRLAVHGQQPE